MIVVFTACLSSYIQNYLKVILISIAFLMNCKGAENVERSTYPNHYHGRNSLCFLFELVAV